MNNEISLITETINIAGKNFTLERIQNIDDLVDQITDDLFNEDERLPYWAELWPSAIALSEYIIKNPDIFKNKTILELGCGMGLTTMVLKTVNPKHLLATDYEQDALLSTRRNFEINELKISDLQLLDWRNPGLEQKFEVIVASDVAYEQRFFQPLIDLFENNLQKKGNIILAEPSRPVASKFFDKLIQSEFIFDKKNIQIDQNGHKINVGIYSIHFGKENNH